MTNKTQSNVASFVLRFTQDLWQNPQGKPKIRWRGHIRHVQGDQENHFTDFSEAVSFIQRNLTDLTLNTISGKNMNQEEVLRENVKFWEDFSAVYSGMMFEAIEQSLKQSEAFKQQMRDTVEQTLKAWQWPVQPEFNQTEMMEKIEKLQKQVDSLSRRVTDLEVAMSQRKA